MGISIVICTFNSSESLERCLNSLIRVKDMGIDYEIVIIDNNSNDNTKDLVEQFRKLNDRIIYNFFPIQGLAKARNYGIKMSKKEYILFTDDDITFDKNFLIGYKDIIEASKPGLAGGRILLKYATERPKWLNDKIDYVYGWLDYGTDNKIYPEGSYPLGPSFLVKRSLLSIYGEFDENLGLKGNEQTVSRGEETELAIRFKNKGILMHYCGSSLVYHNVNTKRLKREWFISRFVDAGKLFTGLNSRNYLYFYLKYLISVIGKTIYHKKSSSYFYYSCKNHYFKNILKIK
jgi:glucosyl-dolichyl phosphate glucuronosyltransferase